jgi:nucleoside triphosphate diphosphatase
MKKISDKNHKKLNNLKSINKIRKIIQILRDPDDGCPWDLKQNFNSLAPYTIEEAYELVDAIEQNDIKSIKSELGDLLLQIILISQIASDNHYFNFDDVAEDISEKMIRRHPQIFDYSYDLNDFPQDSWERIKNIEKSKKANINNHLLDTIEKNIPAMLRSIKIQKKASSIKFDWKDLNDVINKVDEEMSELKEAINNNNKLHIEEELGDLLFTIVNLSRHLKLDPEQTLRKSNNKFISRFNIMENILDEKNIEWHDLKNSDLLTLWNKAKDQLKRG